MKETEVLEGVRTMIELLNTYRESDSVKSELIAELNKAIKIRDDIIKALKNKVELLERRAIDDSAD